MIGNAMKKDFFGKQQLVSFAASSVLLSQLAYSAPGNLQDIPLNLGIQVQPNILFLVDDSGSMGWEVLLTSEARVTYAGNPDSGDLNFFPNNTTEVMQLCNRYNAMAYDPTLEYTPWVGVDEDDIPYSTRTLTTALNNPYDNDNIDDVSSHFYMHACNANHFLAQIRMPLYP